MKLCDICRAQGKGAEIDTDPLLPYYTIRQCHYGIPVIFVYSSLDEPAVPLDGKALGVTWWPMPLDARNDM